MQRGFCSKTHITAKQIALLSAYLAGKIPLAPFMLHVSIFLLALAMGKPLLRNPTLRPLSLHHFYQSLPMTRIELS